jgi:hypothetical protein
MSDRNLVSSNHSVLAAGAGALRAMFVTCGTGCRTNCGWPGARRSKPPMGLSNSTTKDMWNNAPCSRFGSMLG